MPLAAVLSLQVHESTFLPTQLGRALRAWTLRQIESIDPTLSQSLHDTQRLPAYTVSDLQGVKREGRQQIRLDPDLDYWFRITALTPAVERALRRVLQERAERARITLLNNPVFWTATTTDHRVHPWAGEESYAALEHRVASSSNLADQITFRFASPVAFKRDSRDCPRPEPSLVFGNLLRRWNTYAPHPMPDLEREDLGRYVTLDDYDLDTELTVFGGSDQEGHVGSRGWARYRLLEGDPQRRRPFHLLAAYTRYTAIGASTAVGFGQTRVVDDEGRDGR